MDRQDLTKLYLAAANQALENLTSPQRRKLARLHAADQIVQALHELSSQIAQVTKNAIHLRVEEDKPTESILITVRLKDRVFSERLCVRGGEEGGERTGLEWRVSNAAEDLTALASAFNPLMIMSRTEGGESMSPYTRNTPRQIVEELAKRIFAAAAQTSEPKDVAYLFGPALKLTGPEQNEPLRPEIRSPQEFTKGLPEPGP